jgi:hypothetical protein
MLVDGKVVGTDRKAGYASTLNPRKYGKKFTVQLLAYDKAGNLKYSTQAHVSPLTVVAGTALAAPATAGGQEVRQIAWASSVNAAATRSAGQVSAPSSWWPWRRFWTKALPRITIAAD